MTDEKLTPEQEYRRARGVNYSSLSALAVSPKYYRQKQEQEPEDTDAFIRGSAVDCLLTTPEEFNKQFYVMTANLPTSEMMLAYVNNYIETEDHAQAQAASGYKRPLTSEKWVQDGQPYYDAIKASEGKRIMTFDTYSKVQAVVKSLKESKWTKKYFDTSNENIDIKFQQSIYWDYKGTACKSLLDIILVDHMAEVVIPIDIKTTSASVYAFPSSFKKWKYYLQAAFYTRAMVSWMEDESLDDYDLLPFRFVVGEMDNYNLPLVYVVSDLDLAVGDYGGKDRFGNKVKGWVQLLKELNAHIEENNWDYPAEIEERSGEVSLETFVEMGAYKKIPHTNY